MDSFSQTVAGGSVANLLFVVLFAIGAFIKSRLQKSNCKMDCGWLTCDSSLIELGQLRDKLHHTQRDQMDFLKQILEKVQESPENEV